MAFDILKKQMMNNNSTTYLYLLFVFIVGIANSQTVTIGNQTWMTKNLDVSTFRNGDTIPEIQDVNEWAKAGEEGRPAWCYYDNDSTNGTIFGKLYNWYAVNDPRGLVPVGYYVPTDAEWTILTDFLGSEAGTKMKSMPIYETKISYVEEGGYYETKWVPCNNCSYWTEKQKANNPCTACRNQGGKTIKTGKYIPKTKRKIEEKTQIGGWDGTNESGFSGLPGGYRNGISGEFRGVGANCLGYRGVVYCGDGHWWSSSESSTNDYMESSTQYAWEHNLFTVKESEGCNGHKHYKGHGFSVRCIKDTTE